MNGQTGAERQPVAGRVAGLAIGPGGAVIYAASANGGVFRSRDGALSWEAMDQIDLDPNSPGSASLICGAIAMDPTNPRRVFVGTGEGATLFFYSRRITGALPAYRGIGVLRTDDGGETWEVEASDLAGQAFFALALNPVDREGAVAATTAGLYRRKPQAGGKFEWVRVTAGVFSSVASADCGGCGALLRGALAPSRRAHEAGGALFGRRHDLAAGRQRVSDQRRGAHRSRRATDQARPAVCIRRQVERIVARPLQTRWHERCLEAGGRVARRPAGGVGPVPRQLRSGHRGRSREPRHRLSRRELSAAIGRGVGLALRGGGGWRGIPCRGQRLDWPSRSFRCACPRAQSRQSQRTVVRLRWWRLPQPRSARHREVHGAEQRSRLLVLQLHRPASDGSQHCLHRTCRTTARP